MATSADTTTRVLRATLKPRIYRDVEVRGKAKLDQLAKAIVSSYGFDFDHAFGFFSKLTGNIYDSPVKYELFADTEAGGTSLSVKRNTVATAFPCVGSKMLFLFDYGDEWRIKVECRAIGQADPSGRYPVFLGAAGRAPPQYEVWEDE